MARRQPFAPFRATALENEATAFGAHALAKSMCFGAAAIVGLKSSLHCDAPDAPKVVTPPKDAAKVDLAMLLKRRRLTIVFSSVKELIRL
jgi:hypothetical protein